MTYESMLAETVAIRGHRGDAGEAYYARPLGGGPWPGVVLIHHMPGWDWWIKEATRTLAHHGFATISPHLYFREGPGSPDDVGARVRAAGGVSDEQVIGDVAGAMAFLRAQPYANGKVGVIGFCSGGRHTYLVACSLSGIDAAVDCWGGFIHRANPDAETNAARPKAPLDMVGQLHCPLFGVFGEEDQNPPVELEAELKKRGQAAHKDVTTKVYKNAGHAFLADYRPSYREAAAQELWADATSFFGKHLK